MHKIIQHRYGGPEVLELVDVDTPTPDYGQVLVRVGAAGVNPVDEVVRAGAYQPRDRADADTKQLGFHFLSEPPFTVGWDVAGTVVAVGTGISAFSPGDDVFGLVGFPKAGNAYADHVLVSQNEIVQRPDSLTVEQAGAIPLVALTAWQALVGIADVQPGQRVLIHAAAGGVGHVAVQIAKARGAHVIGTASAPKHDFVKGLGADEVIDYRSTDFETAIDPVDVVFELVGGDYAERSAKVLKPGGLLIGAIGADLGMTPDRADDLGIRWEVVSVRPSTADLTELVKLVDAGRLTVHVDQTVPLAEAAKAHELLADGHVTGKLVLVP